MDIQNTFSDIRNCFPDMQNNYLNIQKNEINVNSACHRLEVCARTENFNEKEGKI